LAHGFDKMLDVMLSQTLNEYFISETSELEWVYMSTTF